MVAGLDRETLLTWMREVDAGPFSVLAAGERVAYPNQDMMSLLAGAATVTDRVRIEATVSITPMHVQTRGNPTCTSTANAIIAAMMSPTAHPRVGSSASP